MLSSLWQGVVGEALGVGLVVPVGGQEESVHNSAIRRGRCVAVGWPEGPWTMSMYVHFCCRLVVEM